MSYIVLARKWRPQDFDDLIGQETVVKTLKNALSSNKIVHAYLFSGPRGVGKTSTARILAKALNCINGPTSKPCSKCVNCKAITDSSSVDVFEIDGASNTGVENVRELREAVKYAPSSSKYKIYIIDEVHMLSVPAFNALLKTLEEPPAHVIFIFATTEPKKIPSTILSRCQHHAFRKIPKREIKEQLRKIIHSEKINIKEAAIEMIARAADGSMRDALTLLDQASSFSDDITEKELQTLLGLPEADIIFNLSESILKGDISNTLSILKELTDRGSDLRQITKELIEHFRNIAIVKIAQDAEEFLEFTQEEVERLQYQASKVSIEELTLLLTELLKLESEVRNAINPRYTLELGLLRTSFVKGMTSIENILKMLGDLKDYAEVSRPELVSKDSVPVEEEQTEATESSEVQNNSVVTKEELWQKLLENLNTEDHLLTCKLTKAKIIDYSTTELTIGFNGGMSVLADSIKRKSSIIERILKNLTGNKLKLKIISLPQEETKKDINKLKEDVISEPIVQNAMRLFNGSILEVKSLEDEETIDDHG